MPTDFRASTPSRQDLEILLAILKDGPRRTSVSALDVRRNLPSMSLDRAESLLLRLAGAGFLDWNPHLGAMTLPPAAAPRIAQVLDQRFDTAPTDWTVAELMRRIRRFNATSSAVVKVSRMRLLGPALTEDENDETLTVALGFEDLPIDAAGLRREMLKLPALTRRSPRFRANPLKVVRAAARRAVASPLTRAFPRLSVIAEDQIGAAGLAYFASLAPEPGTPGPGFPPPAGQDTALQHFYAGDTFHFRNSGR